jgi:hypothetical protein
MARDDVKQRGRHMASEHNQRPRPGDEFSRDTIERALHSAVADLYQNEPDIDCFSSETAQTEWNLAAHLAPEIVKYFKGYSYDIDVTKVNYSNRRPDIIIHRRGPETKYNLLVVEVKREGSAAGIRNDVRKIQDYWFSEGLQYQFGATVNLRARNPAGITVFGNPCLADAQSS